MSNNRTALSLATRNGRLLKRPAASRMGLAETLSSTVWRAGRGGYAPTPESVRPPSNGSARRLRPRRHHEIQRHLVIKIIIQLYFKTTNTQRRSGILIKNTIEAPP